MKAIEQAIEALEVMAGVAEMVILPNDPRMNQCNAALAALREAVKQEPVANSVKIPTSEDEAALMVLTSMAWLKDNAPHRLKDATPQAPKAEPVLLSDAEIDAIFNEHHNPQETPWDNWRRFARAVIARGVGRGEQT